MGLDLGLAVIVLLGAIRGWFKGFLLQAIGLAALIGCVYLADPVRDMLRPYARELFPAIAPAVQDRLLWWCSAVASYVVTAGLAGWIVKLKRRKPYGDVEPNRADQGGGFVLGGLKGAVMAAFIAAALHQYLPGRVKPGGVFEEQTQKSQALAWTAQYRPAEQIWNSAPVQAFVAHVRRRGFWEDDQSPLKGLPAAEALEQIVGDEPPAAESGGIAEPSADPVAGEDRVRTARRTPELRLPTPTRLDPDSPGFAEALERELGKLGLDGPKSR